MMTWCFARNYLQPNTHCSGSPPSLHTWSIQAHIPVSVSAFIMTPPGWLGGDCGIKMHIPASPRPWHHPIQAPLAPGAADPLTFTGVWVNIWAPLCVRYTGEHKYRETSRVRWGEQFVLPRPNTSSRPCDWLRFYLKTCQMFKYLPDSWHIFSKVSVSSPDMSKAKDQGWMFDSGLSA